MKAQNRRFTRHKALIGLLILTSASNNSVFWSGSAANAARSALSGKKMCRTSADNPVPKLWRQIAYEAAERVHQLLSKKGYTNTQFENPEHIYIGNNPEKGWGCTRLIESINEYGVEIDVALYKNYIEKHPETGLSSLRMSLFHEFVHLYLLDLHSNNQHLGALWKKSDNVETAPFMDNNAAAHTRRLAREYVEPYSPLGDHNMQIHEQLADMVGAKAAGCYKCVMADAQWNLTQSPSGITLDQLNRMNTETIKNMMVREMSTSDQSGSHRGWLHQWFIKVATTIKNILTKRASHPSNLHRGLYQYLIAQDLKRRGYTPCPLHG